MADRTIWTGVTTGFLLGALLMIACLFSNYPLDRILLDLSYIPLLSEVNSPLVQWVLHILVAVVIAFLYAALTRQIGRRGASIGLIYGALLSLTYFLIAPQVTPDLISPFLWTPFVLWLGAHLLYGYVLDRLL